jgi:hypothetical protein
MMLITFSLFWFTYRYQMIYVSYAKAETNGLIYPKAINQLFTGLYFLQLCLIGLFFLQDDGECVPQAIIMIVTLSFTVLYQIVLNRAFGPLFTYLPITFEDEAVQRDEEFQRAQATRWEKEDAEHQGLIGQDDAKMTVEDRELAHLEEMNRQDVQKYGDGSYEMKNMNSNNSNRSPTSPQLQLGPAIAQKLQLSLPIRLAPHQETTQAKRPPRRPHQHPQERSQRRHPPCPRYRSPSPPFGQSLRRH